MLQALRDVSPTALPFVRQFYCNPSRYLLEDDEGVVHEIDQGEGGEQGDPLMPLLFSLGQHAALRAVQRQLLPGELVLAYLDDIYVITTPDRVLAVYNLLQAELWRHARIRVHDGKTQVWNKSGMRPRGCDTIDRAARATNPCGGGQHCPRTVRASRSWVVLWAMIILFMLIWRGHIKLTGRCSSASPESPTSNQRGHCSCIVPVPRRIIHCGW